MRAIEPHFQLFRDQAEAWRRDHEDATACHELQEAIAFGTSFWAFYRERLFRRTAAASEEAEVADARRHERLLRLFAEALTIYREIADDLAARGYQVDGLQPLDATRREVAEVLSVPLDAVIRGHRQARAGQGRPAEEVRRDLRRRLHT